MKTKLNPIKRDSSIEKLTPLIETIWREVFPPVIGNEQTEYMLKHYQSPDNIRSEIANGTEYYFIEDGERHIGYLAYEIKDDYLFVSKIYLLSSERSKGIASEIFEWIEKQARTNNKNCLRLRVNRGNTQAIEVYLHKGFIITHTEVNDIGEGFAMDDYYLEKQL